MSFTTVGIRRVPDDGDGDGEVDGFAGRVGQVESDFAGEGAFGDFGKAGEEFARVRCFLGEEFDGEDVDGNAGLFHFEGSAGGAMDRGAFGKALSGGFFSETVPVLNAPDEHAGIENVLGEDVAEEAENGGGFVGGVAGVNVYLFGVLAGPGVGLDA